MAAELVHGDDKIVDDLIEKVLSKVAMHPRVIHGSPIIVAIEGCAADAMYLGPRFMGIARALGIPICVMRETRGGPSGEQGFGVPKNAMITQGLVLVTSAIMSRGLLVIPSDFISVSSSYAIPPKTPMEQLVKLREQTMAFRADEEGKFSGKHGGQNDDLIITLLMALYWSQIFCRSSYQEYDIFKAMFPHLAIAWVDGASCYFDKRDSRTITKVQ